jgi:anionic cell wall polymer biosynthesis LytR-Cps2A-Psr (LCP) family protein
VPSVYYFISVHFETGKVHAVNIPGSVSVEEFVQGCSTLDQAFLYGGAVFVGTLIEQIMDARIPKYCVFTKDDVIRAAASFGGISVDVDEKAASTLRVTKGIQKLNNEQLVGFLKPGLSGSAANPGHKGGVRRASFKKHHFNRPACRTNACQSRN